MLLAELMSPAQQETDATKQESTTSDDRVYKTTAKDLAALYDENEVAVDDKIGSRKVEVTGDISSQRTAE